MPSVGDRNDALIAAVPQESKTESSVSNVRASSVSKTADTESKTEQTIFPGTQEHSVSGSYTENRKSNTSETSGHSEAVSASESSPATEEHRTVTVTTVPSAENPVEESYRSNENESEISQQPDYPEISKQSEQSTTVSVSKTPESSQTPVIAESSILSPESASSGYSHHCKLMISCSTAVNNEALSRAKRSVLPADGTIFAEAEVGFNDGESVFDVVKEICTNNKIHLDFSSIPVTGGAYIKGIANLYEFDCGPVSGWMYRVNGEFPNVGCSDYRLSEGDEIAFLYSCDLGADIGNIYRGG